VKELTEISNPPETQIAPEEPRPARGRKRAATKESKTPARRGAARLHDSVNNMTGPRRIAEFPGAQKAPSETKKKKRGIQPWVERLCSEPEWEGPWEDEDAHLDASKLPSREPDLPTN
jgi:hypothetical protein